jgi:hypothetical protein
MSIYLSPPSIATLRRLTFRLLVVAAFAVLWPGPSAAIATGALSMLLGAGCLVAAHAFGETFRGHVLNRWHEAAILFVIGILIFLGSYYD